jgi:hypothetical protein
MSRTSCSGSDLLDRSHVAVAQDPQPQAGSPACGSLWVQVPGQRAWCDGSWSVGGGASPVRLAGRALPERLARLVDLEARLFQMLRDRLGQLPRRFAGCALAQAASQQVSAPRECRIRGRAFSARIMRKAGRSSCSTRPAGHRFWSLCDDCWFSTSRALTTVARSGSALEPSSRSASQLASILRNICQNSKFYNACPAAIEALAEDLEAKGVPVAKRDPLAAGMTENIERMIRILARRPELTKWLDRQRSLYAVSAYAPIG